VGASHYRGGVVDNDRIDFVLVLEPGGSNARLLSQEVALLRRGGWQLQRTVERCDRPSDRGVTSSGRIHFCSRRSDTEGYSPDHGVFITIDQGPCGPGGSTALADASSAAICVTLSD
jgi:hypothetical protein